MDELLKLFKNRPAYQSSLCKYFTQKRKQMETKQSVVALIHQQNQNSNGKSDVNEG